MLCKPDVSASDPVLTSSSSLLHSSSTTALVVSDPTQASSDKQPMPQTAGKVSNGEFGHVKLTTLELTLVRIPSVLWQCLWAWCFGPWVLFRTRKIKDTHYWRIQTQLAVVAAYVLSDLEDSFLILIQDSMPGTPLWLGFLYGSNSSMAEINKWFPPAMWSVASYRSCSNLLTRLGLHPASLSCKSPP